MQDKIRMIQEHLLNKEFEESEEIISGDEPTDSDKQFWLADY